MFRFIPFRYSDIVRMCVQEGHLHDQDKATFAQFCSLLANVFHYEFKFDLDALKQAYSSIDPDTDTRLVFPSEENAEQCFVELLKTTLQKANYEAITEEELNQAMTKSSLFDLRLHVDFNEFSEVLLFCRGQSLKKETVSRWWGVAKKELEFVNFDRVVVYIRFKTDHEQAGATMLKLFQNVPKADLEMLFPNTQLLMRWQDKLLIGVPAVVSGGIVLSTKVGATLLLLASMFGFWLGLRHEPVEMNVANLTILFAGLGALGGYLWKQFSNIKNRKLKFMQQLTQNLYFKNLDNNAGVIFRLLNDAEEEECKEALLAYYFLYVGQAPQSRNTLDKSIEQWFAREWNCSIDFEIDDAMDKLLRLGLVEQNQGQFVALPLSAALKKLDERWDSYYEVKDN
ncbi:MAG: DUF3754 domain-containing protein [Pseudomonadales bacterium]|nr:DUF3754 domain-containing protein [Pseudomonadales bacterium]